MGIGLRGSDPASTEPIESLILSTIERVVQEGLTREQVEAGFNHVSYYAREITSHYPHQIMWRAFPAWYYDDDSTAGLRAGQTLGSLWEEYAQQPRLFDEALRRWLLDNPHRLTVTARPDPGLLARCDAAQSERLEALAEQLGPEGLARVHEEAEALAAYASEPDSPEALATLPRLTPEDVPHRLLSIPTEVTLHGGVELLEHPIFTNGILYVGLSFDTVDLTDEESALLPLLGRATIELGAGGLGPEEVALRIARHTGGISAKPPDCVTERLC